MSAGDFLDNGQPQPGTFRLAARGTIKRIKNPLLVHAQNARTMIFH